MLPTLGKFAIGVSILLLAGILVLLGGLIFANFVLAKTIAEMTEVVKKSQKTAEKKDVEIKVEKEMREIKEWLMEMKAELVEEVKQGLMNEVRMQMKADFKSNVNGETKEVE